MVKPQAQAGPNGVPSFGHRRRKPPSSSSGIKFQPVHALLLVAFAVALFPLWLHNSTHADAERAMREERTMGRGRMRLRRKTPVWGERGKKGKQPEHTAKGTEPQPNVLERGEIQHEWQEPHNNEVWPKPDDWESYGFHKIRKHFKCKAYAHDQTKPLPTLEDWKVFQKRYKEVVDPSKKFDDPVPPTEGYTMGDGGPPPYYAKHSADGRGRGLFASRDIQKGEQTHDGTHTDVEFPSGAAWREYVFGLPRNKACDFIDWTWTQQLDDGKWHVFAAINISVFHNGATGKKSNVNPRSATSSKFFADRDIKKDEELLTDYEWYDTVWKKVGL